LGGVVVGVVGAVGALGLIGCQAGSVPGSGVCVIVARSSTALARPTSYAISFPDGDQTGIPSGVSEFVSCRAFDPSMSATNRSFAPGRKNTRDLPSGE